MENALASELLTDSYQAFENLPQPVRMQLGPFTPQLGRNTFEEEPSLPITKFHGPPFKIQDSKTISIHSLQASAFRLRYGNNYPRFPAHLIQHLQPQLFPTAVDQRLHFTPGAFRPFNIPPTQNKLFPSAFAPPLKSDTNVHDSVQEISSGAYISSYYNNETDEDSSFRSTSEREIDFQCSEQTSKLELVKSASNSTPSPPTPVKEEKVEGCNGKSDENLDIDNSENRNLKRGKISAGPTSCPICGIMVLLGEAEAHFFKELEKLSHITSINREKKFVYDKYQEGFTCFSSYGSRSAEENGHASDSGIPRGRWETYQRIKSNRLSRLRIKNRKKKNGDSVCPVCNEKIQGSVEDINLHVEHCLKKHSDDGEDDEDENIDVEGDSEVFGEYEWTGRHLIRATTFLVGGFAAGLLTTTNSPNHQIGEKDERMSNTEGDESSRITPAQLSDTDTNVIDEDNGKEKKAKNNEKNLSLSESDYGKFSTNKSSK